MNGWLDTYGADMTSLLLVSAVIGCVVFIIFIVVCWLTAYLSVTYLMLGLILSAVISMLAFFIGGELVNTANDEPRIESVQQWAEDNYGSLITEETAAQFIEATEPSHLTKEPILFPVDGEETLVKVVQGADGGFVLYEVDGTLIPQDGSR